MEGKIVELETWKQPGSNGSIITFVRYDNRQVWRLVNGLAVEGLAESPETIGKKIEKWREFEKKNGSVKL